MTCEGCGAKPEGDFGLHDYCEICGMNLCAKCMEEKKCTESPDGKHEPSDQESEADDPMLV